MSKHQTLKDCCSFQEGYVNPSQKFPEYFGGDIKWLRASDLNDGSIFDTERKLSDIGFKSAGKSALMFQKNTLAISKSGTIGALGILKNEMCGNRAVINISVNSEIADLMYIFYTLKYKKKEIVAKSGGSIQKNLYVSALETLTISHADKGSQIKVSSILSALDAKIELNNRINAELEAMAKTLYDYWFVQFDFPDENGKPYKSSGGKMVYNETLKREIPAGWEVFSLSSILKSNYSSIGKNDEFEEIEYLDTSSITKNKVGDTECLNPKVDKIPSRAKRIVHANDILYSTVRPNLCHYGIIKSPIKNMVASTGFVQLSSKVDWISNDFIYTFLTSSWVTARLQTIAALAVSAYPSISPNDILELNIALPRTSKMVEYLNSNLDTIYSKISLNQKENQQLTQLRDWLLPMLMNGQVTVK